MAIGWVHRNPYPNLNPSLGWPGVSGSFTRVIPHPPTLDLALALAILTVALTLTLGA